MEIPIIHSHRLFQRVVSGAKDTSIDQLEKDREITRTIVPHEAVIYKSKNLKATMVELEHAHHNNGSYIGIWFLKIVY